MKLTNILCCPHCHSKKVVKNGHSKQGKQNYLCKKCKRNFLDIDRNKPYMNKEIIDHINRALLERASLRGICRIFKISLSWLLIYIDKLYESLPNNLNLSLDLLSLSKALHTAAP